MCRPTLQPLRKIVHVLLSVHAKEKKKKKERKLLSDRIHRYSYHKKNYESYYRLWLNRSLSLQFLPSPLRSLTFSTRVERLIRYQRYLFEYYLISWKRKILSPNDSRIERKLLKSSFVEKFVSSISFPFFLLAKDLFFCGNGSIESCQRLWGNNAMKRATPYRVGAPPSFRNAVFREMTLGKDRSRYPHTFVGHEEGRGGHDALFRPIVFQRIAFFTCASRGKNVILKKKVLCVLYVQTRAKIEIEMVENSYRMVSRGNF